MPFLGPWVSHPKFFPNGLLDILTSLLVRGHVKVSVPQIKNLPFSLQTIFSTLHSPFLLMSEISLLRSLSLFLFPYLMHPYQTVWHLAICTVTVCPDWLILFILSGRCKLQIIPPSTVFALFFNAIPIFQQGSEIWSKHLSFTGQCQA